MRQLDEPKPQRPSCRCRHWHRRRRCGHLRRVHRRASRSDPRRCNGAYITPADQLFVTSFGGELTQYDLDALEPIRTFGGSRGYIQEVFGTGDGTLIATKAGDRSVTLYDVATGVRLGTPLGIADNA